MKLNHVAIWAHDLDLLKDFYARWLEAAPGTRYTNPAKRFESYMLRFPGGGSLELMSKPGLAAGSPDSFGYAHFALSAGSEPAVDALAARMREGGVIIVDGPRRTGDGFYECAVLDPEGNRVEITA